MFETVAPDAFIRRSRLVLYESLPLSIALHLAVGATVIVGALWRVTLPPQPPRVSVSYASMASPPPPPPPPPAARQAAPIQPPTTEVVAPAVIPDAVPELAAPPPLPHMDPAPAEDTGVEGGVEGGIEGGVVGGVVAGPVNVMGGVLMDDGRVHFARDVPLPMAMERQDPPAYPEAARLAAIEDELVVRYTVDVHGRVREILVLEHAKKKMFEESALAALRKWIFRPLVVEGQAREVVHDLQIFFRLNDTARRGHGG